MKTERPRTVLTAGERARVLRELTVARASTEVIVEHLTVAAHRSGSEVSEWTWARLDALLQAVAELSVQVEHTPIGGD